MSGTLRYASLCAGIEAASVAWSSFGWTPVWFSETDPFCQSLLAYYYPESRNLGDLTQIEMAPEVDLVVGGTPCQAFSVAGRREGLSDPRGGLTLHFLRVVALLKPRWVVWENVPGALSIDGGWVFGTVLGTLATLGYGFAYRVLDAQYVGVPQKRRRVFVVAYLGDWRCAGAVLFEPKGGSRNTPPRREAGTCVAALTANSVGASGPDDSQAQAGHLIAHALTAEGHDASEDGTGRGTPLVPLYYSHDFNQDRSYSAAGIAPAVTARDSNGARNGFVSCKVRRLTPRECERLQGFPDDYTLIAHKGKPASDAARYRAIGNSMAVPVMRWIGSRIRLVEIRNARRKVL